MVSSRLRIFDASMLSGWFKSSYSAGDQGECLEVAGGYSAVPVRDSKVANGPALVFSTAGWSSFVAAVKSGGLGV
ncbi:DUF397 domain-containing protein [Streptomyces sp. NPDC005892]|uniref:DUF397 domain-containing protein n=1 Tax=Streptomyces sp. NPDC005892 TaxID=3155593 RepID=UPI0033D0772E